MATQDRNALLHQLEETRNTGERQTLLKRIWRLDRHREHQRQAAETSAQTPLALPVVITPATSSSFSS